MTQAPPRPRVLSWSRSALGYLDVVDVYQACVPGSALASHLSCVYVEPAPNFGGPMGSPGRQPAQLVVDANRDALADESFQPGDPVPLAKWDARVLFEPEDTSPGSAT
jgi:hypothetical protein